MAPLLADGRLVVAGAEVGPATTLDALLAALPPASMGRTGKDPYALLHGDADVEGTAFGVTLTFRGQRLERASLVVGDPAIRGTSWTDYDPATVRAWHDAFLAERLGQGRPWHAASYPYGGVEYERPWGTLGSYVMPQDGDATIVATYR